MVVARASGTDLAPSLKHAQMFDTLTPDKMTGLTLGDALGTPPATPPIKMQLGTPLLAPAPREHGGGLAEFTQRLNFSRFHLSQRDRTCEC